jgi:glycosyltransferase involved in cell wall biosynthesis
MNSDQGLTGKRILFLINSLRGGGAERVFIHELNALQAKGVDVYVATLYSSSSDRTHEQLLELPVNKRHCFHFRRLVDLKAFQALKKFIQTERIDLIYSTLDEANAVNRALALCSPKISCLVREANTAERKTWKFKLWDRITNKQLKQIVAVSKEVRRSILNYAPTTDDKIAVLPNGVELAEQSFHPDHSKLELLTVGRCTPQKDQRLILEALRLLNERYKDLSYIFHLVGDGPLRAELEAFTREFGLTDRAIFHGHVPAERVSRYYESSDIFLLSSRWEGCPNVLLEAFSHGLACLATNVGGVPDILRPEIDGLLVEVRDAEAFADQLERLLKDDGLRQRLSLTARKRIQEHFSMERHMTNLTHLFSRILSSPL